MKDTKVLNDLKETKVESQNVILNTHDDFLERERERFVYVYFDFFNDDT